MSFARTSLLFSSTLAITAALALGAGGPSAIVGDWSGHYVAIDVVSGTGGDSVGSTDQPSTPFTCNGSHGAVWNALLSGTWSKHAGLYRVPLSDSFKAFLQTQSPDATIKKAKFNLKDIDVNGDALTGAESGKIVITESGSKLKEVETGAFAMTLP